MNAVAWRIAVRELAGGVRGFWIYLACLALGAAAIASAGSVTETFSRGLAGEARTLLGGDVTFEAAQRRPDAEERAYVAALGRVSETASLNVMASAGERRRQVDVLAVDDPYPLIGALTLSGLEDHDVPLLALRNGVWGAAVSASFLETFDVDIGDVVEIGPVRAEIRARLDGRPDSLGTPGTFGPEALIALEALVQLDRLNTGELFRSTTRVILNTSQDAEAIGEAFEDAFPDSSLRVRGPEDAVDGLQDLLTALNSFLAIVGIASLIAGGVGVAQATSAFLETRTEQIAALKALGADGGVIRAAYLYQLSALAVAGALIGVALGAAAPFALTYFANIPLPSALGIYPAPLLKALALSVLAAAVFALPALGRARATKPSALFRSVATDEKGRTPGLERAWAVAAAIALALLAILTSERPAMTAALLVGAGLAWAVFLLAARGVRWFAQRSAGGAQGLWRLSLSNLGGPGSLAPTIAPSLGLGLALLTLVASVQANLLRQISETAPANAPSLIFTQIPSDGVQDFDAILAENGVDIADDEAFRRAPFLLVRVMELNGAPVDLEAVAESEQWVVRGETNVTYLAEQPSDVTLTEGDWWAPEYSGPLLVSVEEDAARGLGVGVGDTIGYRVFGRDLTATISSLRKVDWGGFGIGSNTAFILSPGALEAARPYHVAIARADAAQEQDIIDALGDVSPETVVFQTRPALATAARLFADIATAVNAAAGVVTVAALLVLFGAFAAMARKRRREAALLKTFGASRGEVLRLYAGEFAIAAGAGAALGALIGVAAAYPIVVGVFEAEWRFPWREALGVVALAVLVSAAGGAGVGRAALQSPPARVLRSV